MEAATTSITQTNPFIQVARTAEGTSWAAWFYDGRSDLTTIQGLNVRPQKEHGLPISGDDLRRVKNFQAVAR